MVEQPSGTDEVSMPLGDHERQAMTQINKTILNTLLKRLEDTPSADFTDLLQHQSEAYPRLRTVLLDAARRKASASPAIKPPALGSDLDHIIIPEGSSSNIKVLYPLQSAVLQLVAGHCFHSAVENPSHQVKTISEDLISSLNDAITRGTTVWSFGGTRVMRLSDAVALKVGRSIDVDHIGTVQYMREQAPDVPVPDVFGVLQTQQRTYLFMSYIEGLPLDKIWPRLSHAQKRSVQEQLNAIFFKIRSVESPTLEDGRRVFGGGAPPRCKDVRREERVCDHPITEEADFNNFLCSHPRKTNNSLVRLLRSGMREDHKIVMTHGDLHPRNIIVTCNGTADHQGVEPNGADGEPIKVLSLLDWEMCGWYPEHWEFVKALNTIGHKDPFGDWADYLPTDSIGSWPVEYALDTLLSRWLG